VPRFAVLNRVSDPTDEEKAYDDLRIALSRECLQEAETGKLLP